MTEDGAVYRSVSEGTLWPRTARSKRNVSESPTFCHGPREIEHKMSERAVAKRMARSKAVHPSARLSRTRRPIAQRVYEHTVAKDHTWSASSLRACQCAEDGGGES